ncbi:MAG: RecQ family ATP-dependent DNA helicase [Azospira oryzae]|nr:MAG: RecQ family ATP-dependent DNA helicase [Azospira oryzae]
MPTPKDILEHFWGYSQFRPPQEEIINSVLFGQDTLAILPTGGGKSVCFQVPSLIKEGICIVITPLIALMQDQVEQLKELDVAAIAVHSGMGRSEMDIALDNCVYGKIKFLYVSPERVQTDLFQERFRKMNVSLIAIDEAHCISQWGHDFRPPYLQIHVLRELKPTVPFIALTASATQLVKEDIIKHLHLKDTVVFQKSFARDNLSLVVRNTENKEKKLIEILRKVPGSAIIYVRSRKSTQDIAGFLIKQRISATFYHAGLSHFDRTHRQSEWIQNKSRVMVATNAFGMGINKPDVRVVIHIDLPENMEAYYQEAGRAGRDGKRAYATIIYHAADVESLQNKVKQSQPSLEYIKLVYQALANYYQLAMGSALNESFIFDLEEFSKRFNFQPAAVHPALKKLEEEGLVQLSDSFYRPSRIHFSIDKKKLYEFQVANARYDSFVKTLLRMYGGELFSDFVTISESQLAKATSATVPEIKIALLQLQKLSLLDYEPASDQPQITFLLPRQDADHLPIDKVHLEERRNLHFSKMESMISYTTQDHRCRMQVIQEYFNEVTHQICGICDVCINNKKSNDLSVLKDYQEQIIYLLNQKPLTIEELELAVDAKDNELFIEVVREMVDEGIINYDEFWVLHLLKK